MGGACMRRAQGLRTLVLGSRVLAEAEWAAWNKGYQAAASALDDREGKSAAMAEKIERELTLVGVTAIEDKLQEGVPAAIQLLITARIKVCRRGSQLSPGVLLFDAGGTHTWVYQNRSLQDHARGETLLMPESVGALVTSGWQVAINMPRPAC
jgi:hypothetical protein